MYLDVFSDNSFETNCWLLGSGNRRGRGRRSGLFAPARPRHARDHTASGRSRAPATHGHYDHIGAAAEFCGDDLPLFIHGADVLALTDA